MKKFVKAWTLLLLSAAMLLMMGSTRLAAAPNVEQDAHSNHEHMDMDMEIELESADHDGIQVEWSWPGWPSKSRADGQIAHDDYGC